MMQSAHSPTPPPKPVAGAVPPSDRSSSAEDLDDLALGGDDDAPPTSGAGASSDEDPWAVLAAAAGEPTPAPAPAPVSPVPAVPVPAAAEAVETAMPAAPDVALTHAAGETFSMPGTDATNGGGAGERPSLAAQIQSSAAALTHKIAEVDAAAGISAKTREVDERYHIGEKWREFQTNVVQPTAAKTVEKTKEVSSNVKEQYGPQVKEGWGNFQGSVKQRSTEMGLASKWSSLSAVVGTKWNETREQAGGAVEHWKEEQERKKALANANGEQNGAGGGLPPQFEATKEKAAEGWTKGANWVSQRIQTFKEEHEQNGSVGGGAAPDGNLARLDSDGLPSSFRRGG
ncbi:hypothetical protein ACHAWF_008829 [Thalassiosira exigua]